MLVKYFHIWNLYLLRLFFLLLGEVSVLSFCCHQTRVIAYLHSPPTRLQMLHMGHRFRRCDQSSLFRGEKKKLQ